MNKKTVVLGASSNPLRHVYTVLHRLAALDLEVFAFGNRPGDVAGIPIETQARPLDNVDTITLYLNPKRQQEYYEYILSLNPRRVIFNPGTENPELYKKLADQGIPYDISCTYTLLLTDQY